MSSSTKWIVLALVAQRPSYGYALTQQLTEWAVDPESESLNGSSIYQALTRLRQLGLVEPHRSSQPVDTERGNPRMLYAITAAGRERLDEWFAESPTSYYELRARIGLARPEHLHLLLDFVSQAERACLARLGDRRSPTVQELSETLEPWEALAARLIGRLTAAELAGRARWLADIRSELLAVRDQSESSRLDPSAP